MILGIVAGAMGPVLLSSKLLLNKGYGRAEAIEVASVRMEGNLAKSYSGLLATQGTDCLATSGWIDATDSSDCLAKTGRPFDWRADVTNYVVGVVPYKEVKVQVSYTDDNQRQQTVSLNNYVAYPYIHVISSLVPGNNNTQAPPAYQVLYSVPVTFQTKKSVQLSYNFAIRVNDATNIDALDTIYTRARLVDSGGNVIVDFYPETRTPIMTQPLINNWVEADNLVLKNCTLQILWYKQTAVYNAGVVSLKMGNIILTAVEDKS